MKPEFKKGMTALQYHSSAAYKKFSINKLIKFKHDFIQADIKRQGIDRVRRSIDEI